MQSADFFQKSRSHLKKETAHFLCPQINGLQICSDSLDSKLRSIHYTVIAKRGSRYTRQTGPSIIRKKYMATNNTPSQDVQEMVAQADTGARSPMGLQGRILGFVPLCWSLFQLWYASPLPFIFNFGVLNDTEARAIHLTFATFLAFTAYPAMKNSPRDHIP